MLIEYAFTAIFVIENTDIRDQLKPDYNKNLFFKKSLEIFGN